MSFLSSPGSKKKSDEVRTLLERNAELERLLSELHQYVEAKEMQLETIQQVIATLQAELQAAHVAQLKRNLSQNNI